MGKKSQDNGEGKGAKWQLHVRLPEQLGVGGGELKTSGEYEDKYEMERTVKYVQRQFVFILKNWAINS